MKQDLNKSLRLNLSLISTILAAFYAMSATSWAEYLSLSMLVLN
jgi:hypothetical protein